MADDFGLADLDDDLLIGCLTLRAISSCESCGNTSQWSRGGGCNFFFPFRQRVARKFRMEEAKIDQAGMGRLAKALVFICGENHPTTVAVKAAAESGSQSDIKKARLLFLKLKPGDRAAALTMIDT
jgi:hypothetical protein